MNLHSSQRFGYVLALTGFLVLFAFVASKGASQLASTGQPSQLAAVDASDPGMTGWWKLAGDASDSSGKGQTGTLVGFPSDSSEWVAGQNGTALSFSGSDHITLPSGAAQIGSGDFSVSLWANYGGATSGNTYLAVAGSRASGQSGSWAGWSVDYINASTVAFVVDTSNNTGTVSIYTTNVSPGWHHIVGTFKNGVSANLYVDGVLVKTQTTTVPSGNLDSPYAVRIGGYAAGVDNPFIGKVQDMRTYSRALQAGDVSQLYSAGPSSQPLSSGSGTQTGSTQTTTQTTTTQTTTTQTPTPTPTQTQTVTLPTPTNVTATAISPNQITISWSPVSGATTYTVRMNTSIIGTTKSTSIQATNLTAATTYGYTVQASDDSGNTSSQSASVPGTTLAAGTAPTGYVLSMYTYQHAGQGTVTGTVNGNQVIHCGVSGTTCSALLQQGDPIVLTAIPASGSSLARWEDCPGASGNTCTITMPNWNMSMGAFFTSGGFAPKTSLAGIINQATTQGSLTWVFTGDSFTTLNTYSAYIESYFELHYPNINFHFRNAARSGSALGDLMDDPTINAHVDPSTGKAVGVALDSRFDMEAYGWYPDVVSVDFSDNGHPTPQQLASDYTKYISNYVLPNHSTPVLLGFWPINTTNNLAEGAYMETLSDAIDQVGQQFNAPTGMIWHEMKAFMLPNLQSTNPVNLNGLTDDTDTEHLNEAGTLAAAAYALTKLGADGDVSSATVDAAAGALVSVSHATITGVTKNANSGVDFVRKDDRLPMAFDDISRPIFGIPTAKQAILDMNRYMLTVTNLSAGTYDVYVDGVKSATVDSNTLASGWNMTTMSQGPIHDQLVEVLGRIRDKEGVTRTRLFGPVQLSNTTGNPCAPAGTGWWGDTAYNSNSGLYFLPGYRGDYLVTSWLTNAKNQTACFDNLIHAEAQPVQHTFSIRKVSDTVTADNSAPTVSIVFPTNNASLSGSVTITASAGDDTGVAGVQFKVDGANVGAEDTTSSYSALWSSPTVGTHTILAVVRDAAGNRATSTPVTVTITSASTNPSTTFKVGDRVNPTENLTNVRATPAGTTLNTQDINSVGTVIGGPTVASLSGTTYTWWNIDFDSGTDGWVAESFLEANTPAGPDTTAPQIQSISTSTGATSATIQWTTDENSTSQVGYGLTSTYDSFSALDTTLAKVHSVTLTGLTSDTVYHFAVASKDNAGNSASSTPDMTFKTGTAPVPGALGIDSRVQVTKDGTIAYNPIKIMDPTPTLVTNGVFNTGDLGYIIRGPIVVAGATYWYVNFDNSTIKLVNNQPKWDGWVDGSLLANYVTTSTVAPVGANRKVDMYSGIAQAFSVDADDAAGDLIKINFNTATPHNGRIILTSNLPVTQPNTSKAFNFIYVPSQGYTGIDTFQYTLTDGVNTSAPYTVTFNVQPVTSSTWIPPIGIPRPEFGIDDTYRMYDNPANRNPALTYTQNAEGGYYTHYVDNTPALGCSDTRTYGTANAPRCTVPNVLPEGSVVEIHGGPYTYLQPTTNSYMGSKERPIFIRGVGMPRFAAATPSRNWVLGNNQGAGGQYVIMEGISTFSFAVNRRYRFVAFRNSDVYGDQNGGGTTISDSDTNYPIIDNIVYYHNKVHDVGIWDPQVTGALCAQGVKDPTGQTYCDRDIADTVFAWGSLAENIWILDSDLSHSEGDSVQVNAGGQGMPLNPNLHHIYIGRNEMYQNKQTATAIKAATHVVFSQNDMWGIATSSSSLGTATGFSDEGPTDTWWIFNRIHDSELATKMNGGRGPGPYYYIGNLFYDIHDNYPNTQLTGSYSQVGQMVADWHEAPTYFINNTFYDSDFGFGIWTANWTGASPFVISNNIIAKTDKVGQTIYNQGDSFLSVTKNLFQGSATDSTVPIYWRGKNSTTISAFETNATPTWANGNSSGDPMFVDPANGNFNLKQGSPAIDAGDGTLMEQAASQFYTTFGSDIRKDFNGNNRPANGTYDLGAIEYGATGGNQPPPAVIATPPSDTTPSNPPTGSGSTDSDSDGVPDTSDVCASTPAERTVNSAGCPLPTATNFTVTPSLASANLNSVSNLSVSNSFGKIVWTSPVSLVHNNDRIDLNANISIAHGTITVNSPVVPELNHPAIISFYNINLSSLSALKILRDGAICPTCTGATYSNGTLTFNVAGFSTYSILDEGDTSGTTDNTPPSILSVSTTTTMTTANVSWSTDEPATTELDYGTDTNYGQHASSVTDLTSNHSSDLVNLSSNTLYYYRITSVDGSGNPGTYTGTLTTGTGASNTSPNSGTNNNSSGSGSPGGGSPGGGGGGGGGYVPPSSGGGGGITAPTVSPISNISISGAAASGVVISWNTNTSATSQVQYGITASYGLLTPLDSIFTLAHSVKITGLLENTLYHFQVRSRDTLGNLQTSSDMTFFVASNGSVSIATPTSGPTNTSANPTQIPNVNPTQPVAHAPITGWLLLGTTNLQVKTLQQVLNANGFTVAFSGAGSTGNESMYFGPATDAALKKFQCAKLGVCSGAPYTTGYGATGPKTRAALNVLSGGNTAVQTVPIQTVPAATIPVNTPATTMPAVDAAVTTWLYLGVTNSQVRMLQEILNARGFTVANSGLGSRGNESTYFGPATEAALKKFQCSVLSVCSGTPETTGYGATGPKTRTALSSQH